MSADNILILPAQEPDLDKVNDIVGSCVMGWDLHERVKRLSLGSYQYDEQELLHLQLFVAKNKDSRIVGVLALEEADSADLPDKQTGLLLHGLYIRPEFQRQAVGRSLIDYAIGQVNERGLDGLLVKAQSDANSYFKKQGFEKLAVNNALKDYPHRWWKRVCLTTPEARPVR